MLINFCVYTIILSVDLFTIQSNINQQQISICINNNKSNINQKATIYIYCFVRRMFNVLIYEKLKTSEYVIKKLSQ